MKSSHGDKCSCQVLSMAVTGMPDACRYVYCRNVLQRRWDMHCNHGELPLSAELPIHDRAVIHEDDMLTRLKRVLK